MAKNKLILTSIIVLIIGGLIFIKASQKKSQTRVDNPKSTIKSQGSSLITKGLKKGSQTKILDYSSEALAKVIKRGGRPILFFHADWCPYCQAALKDLEENSDKIPSGVVIFKVNYDKETELKKKYNIILQDTFVQVDSQGKEISKWNSGGQGLRMLLANLK